MSEIGGYFELELNNNGTLYHDNAIALNSGRTSFEHILLRNSYRRIFIPYYTCEVILQPLNRLGVKYEFYHISNDFLPILKGVKDDEAILCTNYFGILDDIVYDIVERYRNVIVDSSQAFYFKPKMNIDVFYSPRKFFGLPDGGFAYTKRSLNIDFDIEKSISRTNHLLLRIEEGAEFGYKHFQLENKQLDDIPIRVMSNLTRRLLRNINFDEVKNKRNKNFKIMHKALGSSNELSKIIDSKDIDGPMIYPFLNKHGESLKKKLIANKVFVATYWPNVEEWLNGKDCYESYLINNLVAIPIDQRYGSNDMQYVLKQINSLI